MKNSVTELILNWCLYKGDLATFRALEPFKARFPKGVIGYIEYIRNYVDEYGALPSITLFKTKYDEFNVLPEDQLPIDRDSVIKIFKEESIKTFLLYPMMNEAAIKALTSSSDAVEYIKSEVDNFNICNDIKAIDFFEDTDRRKIIYDTLSAKKGIPTGFDFLDKNLNGWQLDGDLSIILARTNVGKSWIALKSALAATQAGYRVGLYSGEISYPYLAKRIQVLLHHTPNINKSNYEAFVEKDKGIKGKLFIMDHQKLQSFPTVNDFDAFILDYKLDFLIVDQLSLVRDIDRQKGDPLRISFQNIARRLMAISLLRKVPILAPVQANREAVPQKRSAVESSFSSLLQLDHIAESDGIAHYATRVISWEKSQAGYIMKILKNRYGVSGEQNLYEVNYSEGIITPIDFVPEFSSDDDEKENK